MVVAKVASLVVVAALVTKLVAALVGHWVAGLLAGGKCRLAASDPRRRAQPPSREPGVVHNDNDNININNTLMLNPRPVSPPVVHNDNDNSTLMLNPRPVSPESFTTTTTTSTAP